MLGTYVRSCCHCWGSGAGLLKTLSLVFTQCKQMILTTRAFWLINRILGWYAEYCQGCEVNSTWGDFPYNMLSRFTMRFPFFWRSLSSINRIEGFKWKFDVKCDLVKTLFHLYLSVYNGILLIKFPSSDFRASVHEPKKFSSLEFSSWIISSSARKKEIYNV